MYRLREIAIARAGVRTLHMSGADVRRTFLEYFAERDHVAVRSSSVVPLCDPTVPFVNAGMNQFKGIFLGRHTASHTCVVNSQKCVRVGGKHNDLEVVGSDDTHHTFFEMLGNWSFGKYYKDEACHLAWELMTGPFQLQPQQLLVTYFGGDRSLHLEEDSETRDVWRKIGVQNHLLKPLGMSENFWEMGDTGPCGPCTEIHYLRADGKLMEIWNLVFIQYNREADGCISRLPQRHVDTGMGLERVTALLQGVPSNYDTDLFLPIINTIQKESGRPAYAGRWGVDATLDVAYRRLADHSRMLAVCLADGIFPATSLNVKQMLRRSLRLSNDVFGVRCGLLGTLCARVADILGGAYPELADNVVRTAAVIRQEEEAYAKLRADLDRKWKELAKQYPEVESLADVQLVGFADGYRYFKQTMSSVASKKVPAELAFRMYDTHGFTRDLVHRVAQLNALAVDDDGLTKLLQTHRTRHKAAFTPHNTQHALLECVHTIPHATDDTHKYTYREDHGQIIIPQCSTCVLAIVDSSGKMVDEAMLDEDIYIVTKDTNFYCEEGGQAEDRGRISSDDASFDVSGVFKIRDVVFHKGRLNKGRLNVNSNVDLHVDNDRRLQCMRNHTATHLISAALRKVLPDNVICQIGSKVTEQGLVFNMAVYGKKLSQDIVWNAQELVRETIRSDAPVETRVTDSVRLSELQDVVVLPGEVYPDTGLRVVSLHSDKLFSRELCCGTHVPSARHLQEFCVTSVKGAGGHAPTIRAVTGDRAKQVFEVSKAARRLYEDALSRDARLLTEETATLRQRLSDVCGGEGAAYGQHRVALDWLDKMPARVRQRDQISLQTLAETEVHEQVTAAAESGRTHVVHFLVCSYLMESASLTAALASIHRNTPIMLLGCANGVVHVVCTVPEKFVTKEFTATKWLSCVLPVFNGKMVPTSEGTSDIFASMRGTKVSLITCEALVRDAMAAATAYADTHIVPTQCHADQLRAHPQHSPH